MEGEDGDLIGASSFLLAPPTEQMVEGLCWRTLLRLDLSAAAAGRERQQRDLLLTLCSKTAERVAVAWRLEGGEEGVGEAPIIPTVK